MADVMNKEKDDKSSTKDEKHAMAEPVEAVLKFRSDRPAWQESSAAKQGAFTF